MLKKDLTLNNNFCERSVVGVHETKHRASIRTPEVTSINNNDSI